MKRIAIFAALTLGACASKPPPLSNFCELFQRIDFTDPGIRQLNPANKRALIVGENTYVRECTAKRSGGPR